jgi:hypothetical protein
MGSSRAAGDSVTDQCRSILSTRTSIWVGWWRIRSTARSMKDGFGEWSSCRGINEGETLYCRHRVELDIIAFRAFDHRVRSSQSVYTHR